MIAYPKEWDYICSTPTLGEIEKVLTEAVAKTDCPNLCLSGGVDSSLTLHFMSKLFKNIKCFTIGVSKRHPDVYYSKLIAAQYGVQHFVYVPTAKEIQRASNKEDLDGDVAVRLLYSFISQHVKSVIATDCIDELACGYYGHQKNPTDGTFRDYLRELKDEHLLPLNHNSNTVKVFLPYATKKVIDLFLRIPLNDKVNKTGRKQHIMMLADKYLPASISNRWKYGFCDALRIKTKDRKKDGSKKQETHG